MLRKLFRHKTARLGFLLGAKKFFFKSIEFIVVLSIQFFLFVVLYNIKLIMLCKLFGYKIARLGFLLGAKKSFFKAMEFIKVLNIQFFLFLVVYHIKLIMLRKLFRHKIARLGFLLGAKKSFLNFGKVKGSIFLFRRFIQYKINYVT